MGMGCKMGGLDLRSLRTSSASIGIGSMIIFIAMVLVAGIAASVLMQTSTRLEMQALRTGQETIAEVASGLRVVSVEGYNVSGLMTKMAIEISPRAGSPDIDLSQAILEISDSTNKYILRYTSSNKFTNSSSIEGDVFTDHSGTAWSGASATEFTVVVFQDADGSCTSASPIINFGDHVIIAVDTSDIFSGGISPRTDVVGMILPEEGAPGIIGFTSPSSYTDTIMELQ
jgi:flagellin FlaB